MSSSATVPPSVPEEFLRPRQRFDEDVDLFLRVVHVEGCASGGGCVEPPHHELRAVMSRPYGHALVIEHGRQVMRMDVPEPEADRPTADTGVLRPVDRGARLQEALDR